MFEAEKQALRYVTRYDGIWKEDKRKGQGTQFYANGGQYVGKFENDLEHGQVRKTSSSKLLFEVIVYTFITSFQLLK